jgi:hypothetical protein
MRFSLALLYAPRCLSSLRQKYKKKRFDTLFFTVNAQSFLADHMQ